MKRLASVALVLVSLASPCRSQTAGPGGLLLGEVTTVKHTPLAVIITGTQPNPATATKQGGGGTPEAQAGLPAGAHAGVRAAPAVPDKPGDLIENVVTFDPDLLQLDWTPDTSQQGYSWQLRCGELTIRDFGSNETAARQMLLLIRQLRVNQYGSVGEARPILEYWLSDGQAPSGFASGLRLSPVDQRTLRVENSYGQWCVRDAYRTLLSFERGEEDARRALAILRKYRFTQVGIVCSSNPPILLFLTSPGDALEAMRPGQDLHQLSASGPIAATPGMPAPGSIPGQPGLQNGAALAPTTYPTLTMPEKPQAGARLKSFGVLVPERQE